MDIIVLGNGGHSKVIQDTISTLKDYTLRAVLDDKYSEEAEEGGILYGPFSSLTSLLNEQTKVVMAIGNNSVRKNLADSMPLRLNQYASIVHPTAVVSPSAAIGAGTVVMANAVINAGASMGRHCIINTGAIIEHENKLGDYVHISPGAVLTGNVLVEEGAHVGASAAVIPGMDIGSWSVVGAGSTVITPIPSYCTAVGTPARVIEKTLTTGRKSS
ncbi:acetyltransferase [Domibacillus sp. PGB-M46]|uniref:acetyltransferase n=1 Tax=Domibacillus sp. PGB-M46 TaxID=2910255 RepID=UPI001F55B5D2|nr:acetyltransferase [Domibacillus sp. PGB-M46]MCI2255206.1 acetyltransferase [Domibacillus sp. PGB-M46]